MIIHQSLHGYKNGHHKLASSLSLPIESENKMLLFSDWSEYDGGVDGDMSYLTCYPLGDSTHYVVAKTWYAQEAERPGSVWTHSLIIPIDDLGDEFNFAALECYFHRPDGSEYNYFLPLEISTKEEPIKDGSIQMSGEKDIIESAYYTLSLLSGKVIIPIIQPSRYYRTLLLSILQHLPLGILRNVTACSGWSSHKKNDSYSFNLIFCSGINSVFGLIKKCEIPVAYSEQLHHISGSITQGSSTLPDLIRFFSNDIESDPNKLYSVIALVSALENAYNNASKELTYSDIVEIITRCFPSSYEGSTLKKLFFGKNTALLFCEELDYYEILTTLKDKIFVNWESINFNQNASSYLLSSFENYTAICEQLSSEKVKINCKGNWLLEYASRHLPKEWITRLFTNNWNVFIRLATINHDILSGDYWMNLVDARINEILALVLTDESNIDLDWSKLTVSMISNNIAITMAQMKVLHNKNSNLVNLLMDNIDNGTITNNSHWITFVSNHPKETLTWLIGKNRLSNRTTDYLVTSFNANSYLVKSMGSGVWEAFYKSSNVFKSLRNYIFMFALARNWKDNLSLAMLKLSFVKIHNSLSKNNISENEWAALSPYLASLPFWQNWDNCKKLRVGVVETLISLGYSKDVLSDFTSSKNLNAMLVKIWEKKNK